MRFHSAVFVFVNVDIRNQAVNVFAPDEKSGIFIISDSVAVQFFLLRLRKKKHPAVKIYSAAVYPGQINEIRIIAVSAYVQIRITYGA